MASKEYGYSWSWFNALNLIDIVNRVQRAEPRASEAQLSGFRTQKIPV